MSFSVLTNKWTDIPQTFDEYPIRSNPRITTNGQKIHLYGGLVYYEDGSIECLADLWEFDLTNRTWSYVGDIILPTRSTLPASPPLDRLMPASVVYYDNRLFVSGTTCSQFIDNMSLDIDPSQTPGDELWEFDLSTLQTTKHTSKQENYVSADTMAPFKVNNVFNLLIFQLNEYTVQFNLCSRHPCGYWMKVLDLPFTLSPSITFLSDLTFAISGFLSPSDNLPPQFNIKTYTISPLSFEKQNTITTPVTDLKPYFGNYLFSDYIIHLSHQHIPICSTIITKYSNYIQTLINSQFKENSTRELHLLSPFPFPIPPPHFLWFLKLFYNFDMRDCDDETWISIHHLSDYFLVHPSKIESALHASNPNLNQLIHHQIPIKKLLYCNPTTAQTLTLDSAHLLLDHFTIEELNDQSIFVVSLELVIKFPEDRTIANYLLTKFTHPRLYFLDNGQLESLLERLYLSILHNPNQQSPAHEVLKNLVKNYSFYHTSLPLLHKFIKHFLLAVGPLQAPSLILPPTWVPHFNFLNKLNTIKNLPNFHETDPIITIEVPPILSQHILNNHTLLDRYHLISSPSYLPSKSSTFFPQFVTFVMAIYIHLNLKLKQSTPSHLPMIDQYKALVPSVVHGFTLLEMKQLQMEQDMDSELLLLHL